MKNTMMEKLKSSKGESIAEVLVASLVMVLAFVLVGSMIAASIKIIKKTDKYMEDYYSLRNDFETGTVAEGTNAQKLRVTFNGGAFTSAVNDISVIVTTITSESGDYSYMTFKRK